MQKVIIVGATSGIGRGLADIFVKNGCHVGIIGRREKLLKEICLDNKKNYFYRVGDVTNIQTMPAILDSLSLELDGVDLIIISAGTGELNPELNYSLEEPTLLTNVVGFTNIINWAFNYFEQQKQGHIVIISSMAGLRGEAMAPAYNASKSFQINYAEGMALKAYKQNLPVYITDVRPGFVDTDMAKGEGLFWVSSVDKAVKQIYKAIQKKKRIVYVSRRWKYIAWILKIIPFNLYRKIGKSQG